MSSWGQLLYSAAHRGTTVPCREWLLDRCCLILDQTSREGAKARRRVVDLAIDPDRNRARAEHQFDGRTIVSIVFSSWR